MQVELVRYPDFLYRLSYIVGDRSTEELQAQIHAGTMSYTTPLFCRFCCDFKHTTTAWSPQFKLGTILASSCACFCVVLIFQTYTGLDHVLASSCACFCFTQSPTLTPPNEKVQQFFSSVFFSLSPPSPRKTPSQTSPKNEKKTVPTCCWVCTKITSS